MHSTPRRPRPRAAVLDDAPAVRALRVSIPLKPQLAPAALPPHLPQAVADEFAIRYLQEIGASASPENVATVLLHFPLESCAVSAAWKSRGSLADVLAIDLKPTAAEAPPGGGSARKSQAADDHDLKTRDDDNTTAPSPRRRPRGQQARRVFHVGPVRLTFDDMKRKFLLPFKLASPPVEVDVLALYGMKNSNPEAATGQKDSSNGGSFQPPFLGSRGRWETQRRLKCATERDVAPNSSVEAVGDLHKAFYLALPLTALGLPESDERARVALYEALLSSAMVELVQTTIRYLYLTVITVPTGTDSKEGVSERETLFVAIVRRFTALRAKLEREQRASPRPQLAVLIPLLLLALRVDVETLVRMQYPLSFACVSEDMPRVLQTLDDRVSQLLDPDAHWSRLAVLETTHEAGQARASSSFQRARRHRRLRDQFFQTSAALHGVFPDPLPGKCRRVMKLRGGADIGHYPMVADGSEQRRAEEERRTEEAQAAPVSVASKLQLLRIMRRSTKA
ncbi:hypothetical protein BBJ28_00010260 [Nothophytophthora sp. Chile5]|nr:hypothetical protein BBJ28_00010260 [Nothophytophthora sp. Chile5]